MAMLTIQLLCAAFVLSSATEPFLEAYEVQEQLPVIDGEEGVGLVVGEMEEAPTGEETFRTESEDWTENRGGCPSGWSKYGSRCFLFVNSQRAWSRAERYCVQYGANLASVHSSEEYHFLQNLILSETGDFSVAWLGGTDAVENRLWFWSDGSRFDYQNWNRGEPNNNQGTREPCIHMNWGGESRWNDVPCGNSYAFICSLRLC